MDTKLITHYGKLYSYRVDEPYELNGKKFWPLEVFLVNDKGKILGKPFHSTYTSKSSQNFHVYVEMNIRSFAESIERENKE